MVSKSLIFTIWLALARNYAIAVTVPFRDFEINFDIIAEVVRCNDDGTEMAAKFLDMKDEHQELLRYFIQCLLTSEMVAVGDVIRRVDVPITPASELPDVNPTIRLPLYRRRARSLFKGTAYLLIGGVLLTYIFATMYSYLFRLQVESAVVSAPVEAVQSPVAGRFEQLYVETGSEIHRGQPLLRITNSAVSEGLKLAQIQVADAKAELQEQETLLKAQQEQLSIYQQIGESRLQSARASGEAARQKLQLSDAKLKRFQALYLKKLISETVLEEAEDDYILAQEGIKVAEAEVAVAKNALKAVSVGRFFTGEKLEGNVPELEAAVVAARERLVLAEEKLAAAQTRIDELSIPAPFGGRVVKILKSAHNTVNRGEPLVLLERKDNRVVDAYLTQSEVTQIGLNSPAIAYIPAIQKRVKLRVLSIDRTTGFLDQVQSRFYWRGSQDRSANVKLRFEGLTSQQIRDGFPSGLPVVVNFQRESANQWLANTERQADTLLDSAMGTANSWLDDVLAWLNSDKNPIFAASSVNVTEGDALGVSTLLASPLSQNTTQVASLHNANRPEHCTTQLWPNKTQWFADSGKIPNDLLQQLFERADKAMTYLPAPQPALLSASMTNPKDPDLLASRRAFRDADNAAILALAYRLGGDSIYQTHSKRILITWANTHQPDGHPIDETRLDGLLWAYDLLHCKLNATENQQVRQWLKTMRDKKRAWQFGSTSERNNHRTHQLKMLLMLDKLLGDTDSWQQNIADAKQHAEINIQDNGETIDYQERDALYYHVYNLQAWTEIALLSDCCQPSIDKAFQFLQQRIIAGEVQNEFANSTATLDEKRSDAGFEYAEKGGSYDISKTIPAILTYNTLKIDHSPKLWEVASKSPELNHHTFKLVRYHLWRNKS